MTQMPMLLALLGTALMAVVIFAPRRVSAAVAVSFAPPLTAAIEELSPYCTPVNEPPSISHAPTWPALIDERARDCDVAARIALVDALALVRTPWSHSMLLRALEDEHETQVRDAIVEVLTRASE